MLSPRQLNVLTQYILHVYHAQMPSAQISPRTNLSVLFFTICTCLITKSKAVIHIYISFILSLTSRHAYNNYTINFTAQVNV